MAASYGAAIFIGKSGQGYYKDIYLDDTAGNFVRWDAGAGSGAASPTEWIAPENIVFCDLIIQAATGQTKTQIIRNGVPTGDMVRNSVNLSTITNRPPLRVPYAGGAKIQMIQLA